MISGYYFFCTFAKPNTLFSFINSSSHETILHTGDCICIHRKYT